MDWSKSDRKKSSIAPRPQKKSKKIDRPHQSTLKRTRANNRSSYPRLALMAVALSGAPAAPKSPRRTTAQNLQQQPGAEIAMSRKQQPNSIESQSLITYNLNQIQQAVLPAASN
ncbi:hypothetical protein [Tychonema sp. LEGE 07203]|uniref:hypothetical protein n=1 Tax=Tychonema sp. LEGE 07203 TaxID=1828671 RepID=UPI0018823332|nr:hypothetical protein [Tychonema sp. LEGE 07203]MBE9096599.1 hypothetical protein [Tychonema sp. LEGE 07203]